jgi:heme oxygenase
MCAFFKERFMSVKTDIHARVRQATAAVHERLHHHAGFAAAASGTISLSDYRMLLQRLWGFHHVFEAVLQDMDASHLSKSIDLNKRARAPLLELDLAAVGLDRASIEKLPTCEWLIKPKNEAEFMGALYVVEGSTLGGVHIARALKSLFVSDSGEGRRFFLGYGEEHGTLWRGFLSELEVTAQTEKNEADILHGANTTFQDFEKWMSDWKEPA